MKSTKKYEIQLVTMKEFIHSQEEKIEELTNQINNLSNNLLSVGQILKIPTKIVDIGDTELYQVKSGDTLYSIANKYGISLNELKMTEFKYLSYNIHFNIFSVFVKILHCFPLKLKELQKKQLYGFEKKFVVEKC